MTYQKLREEMLKLPRARRANLASELMDSLEPSIAPEEVAKSWDDEIARRIEDVSSGKVKLISGAQVRREARAILAQKNKQLAQNR